MKTRRRQSKKRVGRKTKRGGIWPFHKEASKVTSVRDWDGEVQDLEDPEVQDFMSNSAKLEYDPFDEVEKQKIIDAYAKVGVEHKKEIDTNKKKIDTNKKTSEDVTKILMNYNDNTPCLEYDTYVQYGKNDSNLINYKNVLDTKLKNFPKEYITKPFIRDAITGLQKCTSFFRISSKPTKAELERNILLKKAEEQEYNWKNIGGKRKKNRKLTKKNRKLIKK